MTDRDLGRKIVVPYYDAAENLLLGGAIPWDVDAAMVAFGFSIGPFAAQDLTGLDCAFQERKLRPSNPRGFPISERMLEMGRLGKKAGVGWYRYPGGGGAVEDPLLEDLITEESYFAKITRQSFTNDEIRAHLLITIIDQATILLRQDTRIGLSDIDRIMVENFDFPISQSGLLRYAGAGGFRNLLEALGTTRDDNPD